MVPLLSSTAPSPLTADALEPVPILVEAVSGTKLSIALISSMAMLFADYNTTRIGNKIS